MFNLNYKFPDARICLNADDDDWAVFDEYNFQLNASDEELLHYHPGRLTAKLRLAFSGSQGSNTSTTERKGDVNGFKETNICFQIYLNSKLLCIK